MTLRQWHGQHRVVLALRAPPRLSTSAELRGRHSVFEGPPEPQRSGSAGCSAGGSSGTDPSDPLLRLSRAHVHLEVLPAPWLPECPAHHRGTSHCSHAVHPLTETSAFSLLPSPGAGISTPQQNQKQQMTEKPEEKRFKRPPPTPQCFSHRPVELSEFNGKAVQGQCHIITPCSDLILSAM